MTITLKETLNAVTYYDTTGTEVTVRVRDDIGECDVHPDLVTAVFRYGIKQILADAGAASKGTSEADRITRIQRRADALRDGTWGLRPARALPDGDVWDAAVAAGLMVDTPENRTKWAGLGKKDRNAVRGLPAVAAHLPTSGASETVLAMFQPVATQPTDDSDNSDSEPAVDKPKRARKAVMP